MRVKASYCRASQSSKCSTVCYMKSLILAAHSPDDLPTRLDPREDALLSAQPLCGSLLAKGMRVNSDLFDPPETAKIIRDKQA